MKIEKKQIFFENFSLICRVKKKIKISTQQLVKSLEII